MEAPRTAASLEYVRHLAVSMVEDGGETPGETAEVLGVSERSVWRWLGAWHATGDAGLAPRPGRGRPPKLTAAQADRVLDWVRRSPCDFGFATERWTGPRVALVLARELGVRMNPRYLVGWLGRHGVTPQVPRRVPAERDEAAVGRWVARRWTRVKKRCGRRARRSGSPTRAGSCSRR
jgi:transposase